MTHLAHPPHAPDTIRRLEAEARENAARIEAQHQEIRRLEATVERLRAQLAAAEAAAWCFDMERAPRGGIVDLLVSGGGSPYRVTDCKHYSDQFGWCYPAEGWKYTSVKGRILAWCLPPPLPAAALTQLHDGIRGETDAEEEGRG